MKTKAASFIASLLLATFFSSAQTDTAKKERTIKVLPVPSFGYSPETKSYVGAVSLFTINLYKDSLTRLSNAKLEFNYTWRRQIIVESAWNFFSKHENYYSQGLLHYSKFPDLYYGIGESTPDSLETQYESKRFIADVNVLKRIGNKLFLGPKLVYKNYYAIHSTQPYYDAQLQSGSAFRLGLTFLKDTRNNLLNPWNGTYFDLSSTYSIYDRNYLKLHADLRKYHTATSWLAAAGRLYSEFTFGTPHFYDYACIGGDKYVRGFYYGRLRDKHMSTLQLELRANVIWRLGIAAFGGVTKLYPSFDKFQINNMQANYGAGIRFLIDRKSNINLRFDYAIGSGEQDGFYVAFGESF